MVQPKKNPPRTKNKMKNTDLIAPKKKKLLQNEKKHSKEKKKTVSKDPNPALRSYRVPYNLPDHSASEEVHEIPAIH